MPETDGYPVEFIDEHANSVNSNVLTISSCKVMPPANVKIEYPSPAQFKQCADQRDVTLSASKRDSVSNWADALGRF